MARVHLHLDDSLVLPLYVMGAVLVAIIPMLSMPKVNLQPFVMPVTGVMSSLKFQQLFPLWWLIPAGIALYLVIWSYDHHPQDRRWAPSSGGQSPSWEFLGFILLVVLLVPWGF